MIGNKEMAYLLGVDLAYLNEDAPKDLLSFHTWEYAEAVGWYCHGADMPFNHLANAHGDMEADYDDWQENVAKVTGVHNLLKRAWGLGEIAGMSTDDYRAFFDAIDKGEGS